MSKKSNKKQSNWTPPENYKYFFSPASDATFKASHPIGYFFVVFLSITVLLLPALLFCAIVGHAYGMENRWILLGFAGGFVFGIGIFNFVAKIVQQYLGHWVSIVSFLIGSAMMLVSWLLCR